MRQLPTAHLHLLVAGLMAAAFTGVFPSVARAQQADTSGTVVVGTVLDSIRGGTLVGAVVQLVPGRREAISDSAGRYHLRGVVAGEYSLKVLHPMLDTLGLAVVTPRFTVRATQDTLVVAIGVPPAERIIGAFCSEAQLRRGPAAIVGFVRDPDTELPIDSGRVSLVYEVKRDPMGLLTDTYRRDSDLEAGGRFRICGVPPTLEGRLQVTRRGVSGSEVPIRLERAILEPRGLTLSLTNRVVAVAGDSGRTLRVLTGDARLSGRVVDRRGQPVEGARVTVIGSGSAALSRADGTFSLDSLPTGSNVVEVRKVAFGITEQPVELSSQPRPPVSITLNDFVPTLAPVTTVGQRERDLETVGFTRRKRSQGGYHFDGDQINSQAASFSEALQGYPSIRVVRSGEWSDRYVVMDARDPGGCVAYVVDGMKWKTLSPGDIDQFLRPTDLQAIEIYRAATVPAEFVQVGEGRCMTIVVWTKNRIRGSAGGGGR